MSPQPTPQITDHGNNTGEGSDEGLRQDIQPQHHQQEHQQQVKSRALSCLPCREHKLKCDRQVPCKSCVRSNRVDHCRKHPAPIGRNGALTSMSGSESGSESGSGPNSEPKSGPEYRPAHRSEPDSAISNFQLPRKFLGRRKKQRLKQPWPATCRCQISEYLFTWNYAQSDLTVSRQESQHCPHDQRL
ncbi:hypothetical protein VE01_00380 [Pseudogymnoascus verrucosus]|uniref:Zn(2)-C6 fungal-type domain-containing protein n=1 Tax=Pseudogymnoascus verrucosus TaxID=342668 RepID=A0A2P2SX88_9PEZI|nr:uncharacterized protein VE01_00380 [Pseudogymnoascus verrucosus]OBU01479.1 hypothetical protein VE01_00380 [Pseudogymnoascus verrucosus]